MKKIVFFISSAATGGGIQRSASMITSELDKEEKYSITVVSLYNYDKRKYDYGKNTKHLKGSIESTNNAKKIIYKAKQECRNLFLNLEFDSIIIEGLGLIPFIPKKILRNKAINKIVRDHTGYSNFKKYGLTWFGLKMSLKYMDRIIVLTKENLLEYSQLFSKYRDKFMVIPNTVSSNIKRFSYNSNNKKICFIGRLSNEKGPDMAIEAFSKVLNVNEYSEWKLDLYGTGPMLNYLKSIVHDKKLERNVFFKGYESNIKDIYNKYAFLLVSSKFESFGLVILEALKAGIPVVSFDCNYGPRSLIKDGENGLLVTNGDKEELSKAIYSLISNENLRNQLAKNTDQIDSEFDYFKVITKWENVI
ncbi:glycosyltransferase [Gracilibacillus dipsosauri]|uniref:Glycosyl transferase family 1 domain-containing protein n=1 Tax=Gracilibacillus dipsosauri TaxID=178340 RepID=A0A317KUT3_9BACI|nr:glycosyltransferase [Gracilibacillus dipsosauri]PWU67175.1 hypothetical protein DLJ74_16500 [Gracilibacillus dipsosauri]